MDVHQSTTINYVTSIRRSDRHHRRNPSAARFLSSASSTSSSSSSNPNSPPPPTYTINLSHAQPLEPLSTKTRVCPPFQTNPPWFTREPLRDIPGPITLHRLFLVLSVSAFISLCLAIEDYFCPFQAELSPHSHRWFARPELSLILLWQFVFHFISFIGCFYFSYNNRLDDVKPVNFPVVWRVVSRGFNRHCLVATIESIREEMRRNPLFPYLIEILTDEPVFDKPPASDVILLVVPSDYRTPNGTKFKARALHYACTASVVPQHAWVIHMDEETRPTSSGIKGIANFVTQCEREKQYNRVGQGCILYKSSWRKYPFLTLADMKRTGEDFGHFRFQCAFGIPTIGMHGSYVVVRQAEESRLGFDVGPDGSITEDAWWIFLAMHSGYRLAWVDGFLEEQSTQSITDFFKQRRRWNYGVLKVVLFNPAPRPYRALFTYFVFTWVTAFALLPLQLLYIYTLFTHGLGMPYFVRVLSLLTPAMTLYQYVAGWMCNLREGMEVRRWMVPVWSMVLVVMVPIFQVMENIGLIMAMFAEWSKHGKGFHVVQKSALGEEDKKGSAAGRANAKRRKAEEDEEKDSLV